MLTGLLKGLVTLVGFDGIVAGVVCTVYVIEKRRGRYACNLLGPAPEPVCVVEPVVFDWEAIEAELAHEWEDHQRDDALEALFALPLAPNPKLRYVNGDIERRLVRDNQRQRWSV